MGISIGLIIFFIVDAIKYKNLILMSKGERSYVKPYEIRLLVGETGLVFEGAGGRLRLEYISLNP
ncbi:hypothetical protein N7466_002994 [Penicillium verhagenii]|uniref:uncharacterized protein n=1 Tax=Penicillium verhagenii TaxID=1562060 RepID=UPI002545802A|nr:uncharacterized protein N7466_002994 [Penicillium verhagenii]KAJ5936544.1 hypothetical protein N7466_002994 [Penicillium verhagenii]